MGLGWLVGEAAHRPGDGNEDRAGRTGLIFPADGEGDADWGNQRGGAVPVHGVCPYPDWSQTRAGEF